MKRPRAIPIGWASLPVPRHGPVWRGICGRLAWDIDLGRLRPGAVVPATRTLARLLGVSRNTVALAYDELISQGYLSGRVGDGTYVLGATARLRPTVWQRRRRRVQDPDGLSIWIVGH